jgi:hypothetical protein
MWQSSLTLFDAVCSVDNVATGRAKLVKASPLQHLGKLMDLFTDRRIAGILH